MSKPTLSDIRSMIAAQSPDHSQHGKEVLATKLSFMAGHEPKSYEAKPKKKKAANPESILQMQIVKYLNLQPRILYWANNPQVFMGRMTYEKMSYLQKLRRMGHKKGIPDLCLLFLNKRSESVFCFIELKSEDGRVSQEQIDCMFDAEQRGAFCGVVRSLEELQSLLSSAGY